MDAKYFYMMGLPASGKTTFLVAFTYMLLEQTEKVCLHMNPYDEQEILTEEFKKEMDRWMNFEPLNHTGVGQVHKMKYILYDSNDNKYIFEVPDRSGETFDAIIRDRYIDDNMIEELCRADEILFFINFERMDIGDKEELLTEIPPKVRDMLAQGKDYINSENENSLPMFPGQFAIVELLQILQFIRKSPVIIKFIISAWDKVENLNTEKKETIPEMIFCDRLPLVYQFINTNEDFLSAQYWGVSAQGSDLQDAKVIEQFSYAVEAMQRVKVVDPTGTISFDLSRIFVE